MGQYENTLCVGKVLLSLEECPSTNSFAKEHIAKNKPIDGTTIVTANQTKGRGQYGNSWVSEPNKNIAFSVILTPSWLKVTDQFKISIITNLSIVDAIKEQTNLNCDIKWPNDIYWQNKKIGGILIENQVQKHALSNSIIGVGINVNQEEFENLPKATSLSRIINKDLSIDLLLQAILKKLDVYYFKLRQNEKGLEEQYLKSMLGYQKKLRFKSNEREFEAIVKGIDSTGALILECNGETKTYQFKEVEWLLN